MINTEYLRPKKAKDVESWYQRKMNKKDDLQAKCYPNATILPLCKISGDNLWFGRGGVVNKEGHYCHSPRKMRIECPVDNSVSHE